MASARPCRSCLWLPCHAAHAEGGEGGGKERHPRRMQRRAWKLLLVRRMAALLIQLSVATASSSSSSHGAPAAKRVLVLLDDMALASTHVHPQSSLVPSHRVCRHRGRQHPPRNPNL